MADRNVPDAASGGQTAAAGWYPTMGQWAYWDGQQWTAAAPAAPTKGGAAERSGWYYLGVALLLLMAMVVVMAIVGNV